MSRRVHTHRYLALAAGLFLFGWYGCSDGLPVAPTGAELSPQLDIQERQDSFGQAIAAQRRATPRLMDDADVVGTGVGLTADGRPSIKVFLRNPGVRGIPASVDGIPVETMVTGEIFALDILADLLQQEAIGQGKGNGKGGGGRDVDHTARVRPVPLGMSTGHPDITACTVGAILDDGAGNPLILSNNHCYANVNMAKPGDPVIQPGTFDGGASTADDIGTLFDFEPILFSGVNTIDAAVARATDASVVTSNTTSDCYGAPKQSTAAATPNMKVQKCGRTTGQTSGTIQAINATVSVNYGGGRIALFTGQIVTNNMSAGGDSGSLLVAQGKGRNKADDRKPVGLLFAGSSAITIHNPIGAVLDRFGATIVGE